MGILGEVFGRSGILCPAGCRLLDLVHLHDVNLNELTVVGLGRRANIWYDVLGKIGFAVAIYPITTLLAATGSIKKALSHMRDDGGVALEQLPSFSDLHDVSGLDSYLDDARGTNAKGKP